MISDRQGNTNVYDPSILHKKEFTEIEPTRPYIIISTLIFTRITKILKL